MPNQLTKKVGPLPAWGWGAVLVGGLVLGLYLRRRAAASAANVAAPPATSSGVLGDTSGGSGASQSGAGIDPGLEALVANAQTTLSSGFDAASQGLVTLASTSTFAGIQAQQQAFDYAKFNFGSALDFVNSHYPSGGGGGGSTVTSTPTSSGGSGGGGGGVAANVNTQYPFGAPSVAANSPAAQAALAAHRAPPGGF